MKIAFRRIIKISAILLLLSSKLCAQHSTKGITLSVENVSVYQVLHEVFKQTGQSYIVISETRIPNQKFSINVTNASVEKVMQECFKNSLFSIKVSKEFISIRIPKKEDRYTGTFSRNGNTEIKDLYINEVNGRIVNENGEAIDNAVVVIKETSFVTTTNDKGEFTLKNIKKGTRLEISNLKYEPVELELSEATKIIAQLTAKPDILDEVIVSAGYQEIPKERRTSYPDSIQEKSQVAYIIYPQRLDSSIALMNINNWLKPSNQLVTSTKKITKQNANTKNHPGYTVFFDEKRFSIITFLNYKILDKNTEDLIFLLNPNVINSDEYSFIFTKTSQLIDIQTIPIDWIFGKTYSNEYVFETEYDKALSFREPGIADIFKISCDQFPTSTNITNSITPIESTLSNRYSSRKELNNPHSYINDNFYTHYIFNYAFNFNKLKNDRTHLTQNNKTHFIDSYTSNKEFDKSYTWLLLHPKLNKQSSFSINSRKPIKLFPPPFQKTTSYPLYT